MSNKKGQSLIEVIFAIGVIVLTLSGVVMLMVKVLSSRTKVFDQKKATEFGQQAIEKLIEEKKNDPSSFWDLNSGYWTANNGTTQAGTNPYGGYFYTVTAFPITSGANCPASPLGCISADINVGWSGSGGYEIKLNRYFTRR
ncbi:MAG TPA: prepilin-type N-terminal cleavage/methylation domain-containing protein [Patescibacteria group bacterium]